MPVASDNNMESTTLSGTERVLGYIATIELGVRWYQKCPRYAGKLLKFGILLNSAGPSCWRRTIVTTVEHNVQRVSYHLISLEKAPQSPIVNRLTQTVAHSHQETLKKS